MGNLNFAIIDSKDRFKDMLDRGEVQESLIVFIKDTCQIWTHGLYFGATDDVSFNELYNKVSSLENVIKEIGTSESVKQSHVVLTQEEYDSRVEAGTIYNGVFYYIIEE